MAGGFLTKRILLVRESSPGVIPATPTLLEFPAESFDLKATQANEEINLLGSGGDASPKAFGTSSFNGSVGLVVSTDNIPVVATHVIGAPTATANATAVIWEAATAYVAGDMVNTVTDTKHTLVCYTAGTSGATEPVLNANPNLDRGSRIADGAGALVWIAMPKLLQGTFSRQQQLPTFTVEYELEDASANTFYKRFSNVYMNSLPMAMTGGTISLKASMDFIAAVASDSREAAWTTELASIAGAKIVPAFKEFYSYEDCTVKVDTVALCEVESINLDTNRNITIDNAINGCKIANVGITSISGSMNRVFTLEDYDTFKNHIDFAVQFDFQKINGCSATFNFPLVKPMLADPMHSIDKQAYLNTDLSAYGIDGTPSVDAVIVYPSLVDSTGTVIGAY